MAFTLQFGHRDGPKANEFVSSLEPGAADERRYDWNKLVQSYPSLFNTASSCYNRGNHAAVLNSIRRTANVFDMYSNLTSLRHFAQDNLLSPLGASEKPPLPPLIRYPVTDHPKYSREFLSASVTPDENENLVSRKDHNLKSFMSTTSPSVVFIDDDESNLDNVHFIHLSGQKMASVNFGSGEDYFCVSEIVEKLLPSVQNTVSKFDNISKKCCWILPRLASSSQLVTLKRLSIVNESELFCGLIQRSLAEYLVQWCLLQDRKESGQCVPETKTFPVFPEEGDNEFLVYHECFGGSEGVLKLNEKKYRAALMGDSVLIECQECFELLTCPQFVCHCHEVPTNEHHWGFKSDNWHHFIHVVEDQNNYRQKLELWEDVRTNQESKLAQKDFSDSEDGKIVDLSRSDQADNRVYIMGDDHGFESTQVLNSACIEHLGRISDPSFLGESESENERESEDSEQTILHIPQDKAGILYSSEVKGQPIDPENMSIDSGSNSTQVFEYTNYPPRAKSAGTPQTNSIKQDPILDVTLAPRCLSAGVLDCFYNSDLADDNNHHDNNLFVWNNIHDPLSIDVSSGLLPLHTINRQLSSLRRNSIQSVFLAPASSSSSDPGISCSLLRVNSPMESLDKVSRADELDSSESLQPLNLSLKDPSNHEKAQTSPIIVDLAAKPAYEEISPRPLKRPRASLSPALGVNHRKRYSKANRISQLDRCVSLEPKTPNSGAQDNLVKVASKIMTNAGINGSLKFPATHMLKQTQASSNHQLQNQDQSEKGKEKRFDYYRLTPDQLIEHSISLLVGEISKLPLESLLVQHLNRLALSIRNHVLIQQSQHRTAISQKSDVIRSLLSEIEALRNVQSRPQASHLVGGPQRNSPGVGTNSTSNAFNQIHGKSYSGGGSHQFLPHHATYQRRDASSGMPHRSSVIIPPFQNNPALSFGLQQHYNNMQLHHQQQTQLGSLRANLGPNQVQSLLHSNANAHNGITPLSRYHSSRLPSVHPAALSRALPQNQTTPLSPHLNSPVSLDRNAQFSGNLLLPSPASNAPPHHATPFLHASPGRIAEYQALLAQVASSTPSNKPKLPFSLKPHPSVLPMFT